MGTTISTQPFHLSPTPGFQEEAGDKVLDALFVARTLANGNNVGDERLDFCLSPGWCMTLPPLPPPAPLSHLPMPTPLLPSVYCVCVCGCTSCLCQATWCSRKAAVFPLSRRVGWHHEHGCAGPLRCTTSCRQGLATAYFHHRATPCRGCTLAPLHAGTSSSSSSLHHPPACFPRRAYTHSPPPTANPARPSHRTRLMQVTCRNCVPSAHRRPLAPHTSH